MTAHTHRYSPRGNCRAILKIRDAEVVLSGPAGTGKSRACMEKLHMMALVNPGMRGLIARKTATTLSSTALVTWRRFVANESLLSGDLEYYGGSAQEPAQYRYRNGSVVALGGLDAVGKIMSSEYDVIYIQEATELTETDWEALTTRLRNWVVSFQQIIGDCNPSAPTHWIKMRAERGALNMLPTRHEDNPMLFKADGKTVTERGTDYLNKLDALTGVRHSRLRMGLWVAAEGIIYGEFTDAHILDRIPVDDDVPTDPFGVPLTWRRYWGVDFGFVHPFVLQCWAADGDGRLYMYRELYMTHRTVDQHAAEILGIVQPNGPDTEWIEPRPSTIVADHDAEGRATFENVIGMSTMPAHKSVLEGIEAVQVRLRDAGDGRPRVFFLRNSLVRKDNSLVESGKPTCTVEEIPSYVWSNKKKEEPIKADDDGCDTMRYVVADQDFGVRVIYRSFSA